MADVLEQVRIWQRRIRRRRWLGLAVARATCAPDWAAFGLLGDARSAAGAAVVLNAVLLAGVAAGGLPRCWSPAAGRCSSASRS